MLDFLKRLLGFSAKPVEAAPSAPYKVPEPAATTPIPLVVEVLPAGTEASIAAPVKKARAPAKPKAPAKTAAKAPAKAPAKTAGKATAKPKVTIAK